VVAAAFVGVLAIADFVVALGIMEAEVLEAIQSR